jgi:hypothetical protein
LTDPDHRRHPVAAEQHRHRPRGVEESAPRQEAVQRPLQLAPDSGRQESQSILLIYYIFVNLYANKDNTIIINFCINFCCN